MQMAESATKCRDKMASRSWCKYPKSTVMLFLRILLSLKLSDKMTEEAYWDFQARIRIWKFLQSWTTAESAINRVVGCQRSWKIWRGSEARRIVRWWRSWVDRSRSALKSWVTKKSRKKSSLRVQLHSHPSRKRKFTDTKINLDHRHLYQWSLRRSKKFQSLTNLN